MRTFGAKDKLAAAGHSPGGPKQRYPSLEHADGGTEKYEQAGHSQALTQKAERRRAKQQQHQGKRDVNDKLARLEKMYQELQDLETKKS